MNRFVKQGISLFTMLVLLSAMLASAAPVFAADEEYPPHDGMHGVEPAFARIAGLYAGVVSGLPAGTAHFAAQGGFLRHGRRGAAVHADHVVRRGGTP